MAKEEKPKIRPEGNKIPVMVYFLEEEFDAVEDERKLEGRTRSNFLVQAALGRIAARKEADAKKDAVA